MTTPARAFPAFFTKPQQFTGDFSHRARLTDIYPLSLIKFPCLLTLIDSKRRDFTIEGDSESFSLLLFPANQYKKTLNAGSASMTLRATDIYNLVGAFFAAGSQRPAAFKASSLFLSASDFLR